MEGRIRGDDARELSETLLRTYFRTQDYPYTRHHIESFDQFLSQDLPAIIKAENPFTLLQEPIGSTGMYALKAEVFIGGLNGDRITIGTPTANLRDTDEIRILYPNEARLRNFTYASMIEADIVIRVTISKPNPSGGRPTSEVLLLDPATDPSAYGYLARFPLVKMPIMLHSRYCVLHGKPQPFLREVGECAYDHGGYFIVSGAEKVLITSQEQAFNMLNVLRQDRDPQLSIYGSISCLNPVTRQVKRVAFGWLRQQNVLHVSIPLVRKPIPIFVLFRALGLQADGDIVRAIFPDPTSAEAKILEPYLHESILDAYPFLDTFSAVQFIKTMTKGFSEAHVLDILHNQLFIHVEDRPGARIAFLAECVRQILRVLAGLDKSTDRDDMRNRRCLTSGVLTRMLFQGVYKTWKKAAILTLDKEFKFNKSLYKDMNFLNLFSAGTLNQMFRAGMLTEGIMRGFKGKWGSGVGEEKSGVLQALSRLSYLDFMSHCRRCVKDFDTGMKDPGPRRLHTSQFGYFCTSETPNGASIGITKNLSMLTAISTATEPGPLIDWLFRRGGLYACDQVTPELVSAAVPVFVNSGIVGYTLRPQMLRDVLKAMKWTGCLPASASISFSIRERRVSIYLDEGRPMRPLIHLDKGGAIPLEKLTAAASWRDHLFGSLPMTKERGLHQSGFVDPLVGTEAPSLEDYMKALVPYTGAIEYVDPYEANEAYIATYAEHIQAESSHMEVHPSTIVGLLTSMIPFPNHNQSPRNQLSCSQSKQGLSVYATNFPNRFENQVHVLCYGEAPLVRTLYYDYLADGQMGYGHNLILALGCFSGYNQEDGIVFNADAFQRGLFRNMTHRSYEAAEEDDDHAHTRTRIGNPAKIPGWTSLKAGLDYSKLDDRGIIRVGELVDETTVLVGRYLQTQGGDMRDASVTAQVWTSGRVEKVAVMTDNNGRALVKVRVIQDRVPELGDKFSNRHGQKGTMGMLIRAHDMPRSESGMVPDMIMNPHAIPSRMTMAQMLEALLGKAAANLGAIGNATAFMNEGDPSEQIGRVLREQLGMQPLGEEFLYDGQSGRMIPSTIFIGNVYTMRLKHMTEDKWNARAEGRREQRTHQPTGGRGNQGGMRIGEMERDAISGHGMMDFTRETYMKRSDGYETVVCNGCGTIPIYNESKKLYLCSMCDGPVQFLGDTPTNLELLPANKRSLVSFSRVEIPYAMKVLDQELTTFMNIGMRVLTERDVKQLRGPPIVELTADQQRAALEAPLPERVLPETDVPERIEPKEELTVRPEDLSALGVVPPGLEPEEGTGAEAPPVNKQVLNAAVNAAVNAALDTAATSTSAARVNAAAVNAAVNAAIAAANAVPAPVDAPVTSAAAAPTTSLTLTAFQPVAPAPAESGLDDADFEALPGDEEGAPLQRGGGTAVSSTHATSMRSEVNVKTSTQPVLVVPLQVAPPATTAPPAEMVPPPAPGAPPTFVVDTGDRAMGAMGLTRPQTGGGTRRVGGHSRSPSRGGAGGATNAASYGTGKVTVTKLGGGGDNASASTGANVKVNVVKQG